ncbi:MAG: NADH-quinone oxidoreductase subunit N [Acidimicrobiales bacterium]
MLAQETIATPPVEWSLLWPVIILGVGGVLLVTLTSLVPATRNRSIPAGITAAIGIAAGFSLLPIYDRVTEAEGPVQLTITGGAMIVDAFTVYVTLVICIVTVLVALLFDGYLRREGLEGPDWYVLLLISAAGGVIMAAADDLILLFVGLEILSIAVYVLAALHLRRVSSQEAGFKYFILGALSSAIFLYGIALLYGATGTTSISAIAGTLGDANERALTATDDSSMLLVGIALLLVGFGFKVSAAPFQMWTPDVYQGAPTPVVSFMGSAVKVAAFAAMARVLILGLGEVSSDWRPVVAAMAFITLLVGSFLAIVQTDVKRMLAYSSINHAGFMLVAVHAAGTPDADVTRTGMRALAFYLLAYSVLVVGSFGVISLVSGRGDETTSVDSFRGLARRQPLLSGLFAVLLFAQAGVPFTSGFMAKFRVIVAAVDGEAYVLAGLAMLAAVVAAFLYLRIVVAMFLDDADAAVVHADDGAEDDGSADVGVETLVLAGTDTDLPITGLAVVAFAAAFTLVWGVFPQLGEDVLARAAEVFVLLAP